MTCEARQPDLLLTWWEANERPFLTPRAQATDNQAAASYHIWQAARVLASHLPDVAEGIRILQHALHPGLIRNAHAPTIQVIIEVPTSRKLGVDLFLTLHEDHMMLVRLGITYRIVWIR
jgi:hypothetical protein